MKSMAVLLIDHSKQPPDYILFFVKRFTKFAKKQVEFWTPNDCFFGTVLFLDNR